MITLPTHRRFAAALAVGAAAALPALPALPAMGSAGPAASGRPLIAPYVDMGAPELFPTALGAIRAAKLPALSAGFVTSRQGCVARWDDGNRLAADRRQQRFIAAARRSGAAPIVSFGGAMSAPTHELAESCHSARRLAAAYAGAARQVGTARLDFDIEGARLDEPASVRRRAQAIHTLERQHPRLSISLTVPVDPDGLPADVRRLLAVSARSGDRIAVFNLMTMDYGDRREMGAAAEQAASRALPQIRRDYPHATWHQIGITPMIGRNDTSSEVFTLDDASRIATFAGQQEVARLAFWALGRDVQCPQPTRGARYDCSGVAQSPYEFSRRFAAVMR